jgi:hypothetical protein
MKRFFPGDNGRDYDFDPDREDEDEDEVNAVINVHSDMLAMIELDLVEMDQRQKLLEAATKLASKDFLWYFRSPQTKLRRIRQAFRHLEALVYDDN